MRTRKVFARLSAMVRKDHNNRPLQKKLLNGTSLRYTYRGPVTVARCRKVTMIDDLDTDLHEYRPTVSKL